jgi:regulator of sigma E protease
MDFLFIIISVLLITLLIVVHEFGHYLAAKMYGFQTPIFGIGLPFGPHIDLFKKWNTQFRFYFMLIGGFVAIPETGDETDLEQFKDLGELKPLRKFPVHQRAVVAFAGVFFNIIFAFLISVVMAGTTGLPTMKASTEIMGFVSEDSPAKKAGLMEGDTIISINGIEIDSGEELKDLVSSFKNEYVILQVARDPELMNNGESANKTTTAASDTHKEDVPHFAVNKNFKSVGEYKVRSNGAIGVKLGLKKLYTKSSNNIFSWLKDGFIFTINTLFMMFVSIFTIINSLFDKVLAAIGIVNPSQVSDFGEVKGIVGIVQLISQDIKNNFYMILEFAVLLNLNLAVINLLPIPALDGGHLVFLGYEKVFGTKPSAKIQDGLIQAGFMFLLSVMAITTFNDIKVWIFH